MSGSVSVRRTTQDSSFPIREKETATWRIAFSFLVLFVGSNLLLAIPGECRSLLYVTPSFSLAELYDDNVFRRPNAKGDVVSRFTPGIEASYMALPFEMRGNYHFDSEIFANQSQLTRALARQDASLGASYIFNHALTFAADFAYLQSHRPEEHNAASGLFGGRASTESYLAHPSAFFRLSRTLSGEAEYSYSRSNRGGLANTTHNPHGSLHWRLTRRDTLSFNYSFRQYLSSGQDQTATNGASGKKRNTNSHVPTVEWVRRLSPRTSIALEGGPRFSRGTVGPEVKATLDHLLGRRGKLSLSYGRSQHTVAGKAGPINIEFFTLDTSYQLLRFLALDAAFAFGNNQPESGKGTKAYNVSLQLTYLLNRYFTLQASYKFRLQNRDIFGGQDGDILSDIFMIRLTFAAPTPFSLP